MKTILVVDDSPDSIDLAIEALMMDFRVKAAKDGQIALDIARGESKPDAIVLDLIMPKVTGWEVLQGLLADEETRDIPVVVCSAVADQGALSDELRNECFAILSKPIDLEVLKNTLLMAVAD